MASIVRKHLLKKGDAVTTGQLRHRAVGIGAVVLTGALALSACGSSKSTATTPAPGASSAGDIFSSIQVDPTLKAKLPSALQTAGFVVASDASYAPNEFFDTDNKTIIGMDVDLGKALSKKIGVPFTFQNAGFDSIIGGINSGKYQLGMSSFTDSKVREQTVDFVTYFSAGVSVIVKAGNPQNLKPMDVSLCGKKIAVEKGTTELDELSPIVDAKKGLGDVTALCKKAGKPIAIAQPYPDENGANLALSTGRADAIMADSPVAAYAIKQSNGQFATAGAAYGTAPYGIAVGKNLGGSKDAILAALKGLMADGSYQKVLQKWGVQDGAITSPVINGATS